MKELNYLERDLLESLQKYLKETQDTIVFKSTTEAQAKKLRIQALGKTMETLGKLLGEK